MASLQALIADNLDLPLKRGMVGHERSHESVDRPLVAETILKRRAQRLHGHEKGGLVLAFQSRALRIDNALVLNVFAVDGQITQSEYLGAVGMLGAMRHDHLWLDAQTHHHMLVLDDPRAFALFEAAVQFMGGRNADMPSHIGVSIDMMRGVWTLKLPAWQQGRAVGRLLEQLVRSRPDDWKPVLHVIDAELDKRVQAGDHLARRARDYLAGWITGHFYDLAEIRSKERVLASVARPRQIKLEKKARQKKVGRGSRSSASPSSKRAN